MGKNKLWIILIISSVIAVSPILIFIINFKDQSISDNQKHWAEFGTYISGFLMPIISVFSLIVLIYIYLLIQKLSGKENFNLFKLQRRINAYDNLMEFIPMLHSIYSKLNQANINNNSIIYKSPEDKIRSLLDAFKLILDKFSKLHYFIYNFYPRYSHLFAQNINNRTYKALKENSCNILSMLNNLYEKYSFNDFNRKDEIKDPLDEVGNFIKNIVDYANCLRTELFDPTKLEKLEEPKD